MNQRFDVHSGPEGRRIEATAVIKHTRVEQYRSKLLTTQIVDKRSRSGKSDRQEKEQH